MIPVINYIGMESLEEPPLILVVSLLLYGVSTTLLIHGYFMHQYGQTLGKRYMSIRIENLDGSQASFATIFFKRMLPIQLALQLPVAVQYIACVVNPLFIFGKQRRCLHDYLAKTKVSYTNNR